MALIAAYGEFWSRDAVSWGARGRGNRGSLRGEIGAKARPVAVDVWEQEGVYLLHADHSVVYAGLAVGTKLGPRLRGHRDDHLAGRWDQFSWYGTRSVRKDGTLGASAKNKNVHTRDAVLVIEALMIRAAPEALYKSVEGIKGADLVRQAGVERVESGEALRELLDELKNVRSELADLRAEVAAGSA
jgi:hypothetical protein